MADVKISQLPAVTSVATTDVIPVVTGGVTSKIGSQNFVNSGLSGGTANGVLYLNGSKAATSGSALTFDGAKLEVYNGTTGELRVTNLTNGFQIYTDSSGTTLGTYTNAPMAFRINASEQMRLNSTGLGIGTSSPEASLHNNGINGRTILSAGNAPSSGATTNKWRFSLREATEGDFNIQHYDGSTYNTNLTISYDGNVGIGTSSPNEKLMVNGAIRATSNANNWTASAGALMDYYAAGTTARFIASDGANTGQLYLTTSGNFGLGVTPSAWTDYKALQINTGTTLASTANQMVLGSNWYYNSGDKYVTTDYATIYIQNSGQHKWFTATSGTAGNAISWSQPMTLSADGTFRVTGAGTAGSTDAFQVSGSAPASAVSVDSSGNLLVGKTSASTSNAGVQIWNASGTIGLVQFVKTAAGTQDSLQNYHSGTYVGGITYSNTATALVTSSDVRLKQNIVDLETQLNVINSIKVREFEFKADPSNRVKGFIAQELFDVVPDAVQVGVDNEDGSIAKGWSVNQTALIPILVKAIQEQQSLIESLTARINTLEGK